MIKVGDKSSRRRAPIYPRAGLLRCVRLQGEGVPPSGNTLTKLWSAAYIYGGKNQISNLAFIYTYVYCFYIKPGVFVY